MRDYDPTTGRYLEADPLGLVDGASVYGYVGQSPLMYIDPRGEFGLPGALAGALVGAVAGYLQSGCWQGAALGAGIGAVWGGLTPGGVYWAMGSAGSNAYVSQLAAFEFLDGVCGCNKQDGDNRRAVLIALGSALGGGAGSGVGGGLSNVLSREFWVNGGETLGPLLGGGLEGIMGKFGGAVGGAMGSNKP